jgi:hypothetical protein
MGKGARGEAGAAFHLANMPSVALRMSIRQREMIKVFLFRLDDLTGWVILFICLRDEFFDIEVFFLQ